MLTQPLPQQFSFNTLAKIVRKLHVTNNDIILIRSGSMLARQDVIQQIIKVLEDAKINGAVMVVDSFDNLTTVNETDMNAAGWFKLPAIKNILHRKDKESK